MIKLSGKYLIYFLLCAQVPVQCENNTEIPTSEGNSLEDVSVDYDYEMSNETLQELIHSRNLRFATACEKSDGKPGYCVELEKCPQLAKMANRKGIKFLEAAKCGPENEDKKNPKVCCGNSDFQETDPMEDITNVFPKKCGAQKRIFAGRILGGKTAQISEFPWLALLIHKNKLGHMIFGCAGSLIHVKYVMTAAHCVHETSDTVRHFGPPYSVALGEHDTDSEIDCTPKNTSCAEKVRYRKISKIIVHPEYTGDTNHYNDIALLYLKSGAVLSDFVFPICLWVDPNEFQPRKYYASGWGKTETKARSSVKLKVDLPAFDKEKCVEKYDLLDLKLQPTQLCAGGVKNKDACSGDSGGPLMFAATTVNKTTWYAAGVVSYGLGCGTPGWPGVYTNVTSYVPWITKEMMANNVLSRGPTQKKKHKLKPDRNCTIC